MDLHHWKCETCGAICEVVAHPRCPNCREEPAKLPPGAFDLIDEEPTDDGEEDGD